MTLSSTLSAALSGLGATTRAAQTVSSNLANAMNENYGRRELSLSAANQSFNGGVRVDGIRRVVDPVLLADKRTTGAEMALKSEQSDALSKIESVVGNVDDESSISAHLRRFEASLSYAESNPASPVRLSDVAASAKALASSFSNAQSSMKTMRERADKSISNGVETVNSALQQIKDLNENIVSASVNGHDVAGYLDQRQALIDTVSEFVPVREMARQHGSVSLVTTKGVMLLDQSAVNISFENTHTIMPHMTVDSGDLGVLTIGDVIYDMSSGSNGMAGGRFEGLFQTRDVHTVEAQGALDSLAFELADRFQSTASDPTLGPLDPGLFTDGGTRADISSYHGLAGRLSINSRADPDQGGLPWRIRDGLQAVTQGPTGSAANITGMIAAINQSQGTVSPSLPGSGSLLDLAQDVGSSIASRSLAAEQSRVSASAAHSQMQDMMFAQGVDTDAEMQKLLTIETNYAANARVIQTVQSMLDDLLRIGS